MVEFEIIVQVKQCKQYAALNEVKRSWNEVEIMLLIFENLEFEIEMFWIDLEDGGREWDNNEISGHSRKHRRWLHQIGSLIEMDRSGELWNQ